MTEVMWLIVELIIGAAASFYIPAAITVFLQSFYDNGIAWSRKKACILGIYVLAEAVLMQFFPENSIVSTVLSLICVIIPIYDCKGKKIRRTLRVLVTYMVISLSVVSIFMFGFIYFLPGFDVERDSYTDTEALIINIGCCLFFGFVFYYIKKRLVKKNIFIRCGKREDFTIAAYFVFVFFMLVMGFASTEEAPFVTVVISIFAAVCLMFMIAFPIFLFYSRLSSHYRRANELHETYMQSQLEHFRQYKSAQEETARFRHDIQNNLQCLDELLSSGKIAEASRYLSGLLCEVRALSPKYVSGDEILDCIISSKASIMEREGIAFSLDGVIPGGLNWNAIDVCNVFANALDNAIEANIKMPEGQRYITMAVKSAELFRYIRIENPVSQAVDVSRLFGESGGFTTKKRGSGHGIGTYSIKRTAEKYGGVVRAECEDGLFTLELIINKSSAPVGSDLSNG